MYSKIFSERFSWSRLVRAQELTPEGHRALSAFCEAYRPPVFELIRYRVRSVDEAHERTQGFFAQLLEKSSLASFDPTRGTKFRAWLLGCVKHYLSNAWRGEQRRACERLGREPSNDLTPESLCERAYDRRFALRVLERVRERLRERYATRRRSPLFDAIEGTLSGAVICRPYDEVARALRMTEGAVKKAAFELRERFKKELWIEVAGLVDAPGDPGLPENKARVEEELRYILAVLEEQPLSAWGESLGAYPETSRAPREDRPR